MSEILDKILPFASKWYVILTAAAVVYFLVSFIEYQSFVKKHGCKEATKLDTPYFCIPQLRQILKKKSEGRMVDYIKEIFDTAGKDTLYLRLASVRVVVTNDPENIKAVLATQFNDFALGTRHAHFKPLLGDGIFTLDGEGWKHSRAMLRPQFAREQVAHVKSLEPHLQVFAKHIKLAEGDTINIQDLFFKLTVDTATEFLFGESVHSLYDEKIGLPAPLDFDGKVAFAESFNVSQQYLSSRAYSQFLYFLINNKEFRSNNAKVHKFCKYYVDKALNTSQDELDKKSKDGYIFLYELVKQTRNAKVLQDQLLNILLAGRDTTAGLLSFTFFELARNPRIWEKLKEEIYDHFGSGDNVDIEAITFESMKKCEYLKFVLNEALRLYPSVPINFRVATKTTTLPRGGGPDEQSPVYVGKGTTVAYSVYCTHRLEEYYGKDALEFRPERWADIKRLGWAYVPFNGGPRICLGQQFALTEASYVITRLVQMFPNLVSKDDRPYPPQKSVQLTMCHQDGVFVSLS
ncbi:uncharacterized protein PRCAT00000097001 [Priceomyces carsonii]|uniref:uncharacterized protein n=1 Tax=Priceomyces carsonii TaxID=28549 RepID=UPI002EDA47BA|nr:unnamed protein product [Priceomyces carsonii]